MSSEQTPAAASTQETASTPVTPALIPNISYHEIYNKTKERLTVEQVRGREVTYANYIETPTLLSLQESKIKNGLHHHDEHLFIVVHQSFELWFKQILFELDSVKEIFMTHSEKNKGKHLSLEAAQVCAHRLQRADSIFRYALGTFDVLETMHPADFLEFRDYIGPASGFQSVQLREIELLLGQHDSTRFLHSGKHFSFFLRHEKSAIEKLEKRYAEPSIKQLVNSWLDDIYDFVPENFSEEFLKSKLDNLTFQKMLWTKEPEKAAAAAKQELEITEQFLDGVVYPTHSGDQKIPPQAQNGSNSNNGATPAYHGASNATLTSQATESFHGNSSAVSKQDPEPEESKESIVRRRTAMLFIMCYRHQVELTPYANLIDSIVAIEEGLLLWRSRHVRMVERLIGQRPGTGGSTGVGYLDKTLQYRIFIELWQARSHFVRATALPHMKLKHREQITGFLAQQEEISLKQ